MRAITAKAASVLPTIAGMCDLLSEVCEVTTGEAEPDGGVVVRTCTGSVRAGLVPVCMEDVGSSEGEDVTEFPVPVDDVEDNEDTDDIVDMSLDPDTVALEVLFEVDDNPDDEEDDDDDTFEARKKRAAKEKAAEKARVKDWPPRNQGLFPRSEVWPESDT